jgi:hypothetical protein
VAQGRSNAQTDALTAAARSILSRVQQQNSRHTGCVQELLTAVMRPTWHQHQQTYLRLVGAYASGATTSAFKGTHWFALLLLSCRNSLVRQQCCAGQASNVVAAS